MRSLLLVVFLSWAGPALAAEPIAGSYRCWSYNVSGAGRRCTSPPLILKEDGTYQMSSEKGTYKVKDSVVTLSESKIRGPGRLDGEGHIVFAYDYKGWKHVMTYMRQR